MNPQMNVEQGIRRYIIDSILFGDERGINGDIDFMDSGLFDSLGFLELISFVEKKYAVNIPESELIPENLGSLNKMSRFIEDKLSDIKIV